MFQILIHNIILGGEIDNYLFANSINSNHLLLELNFRSVANS